MLRELEDPDVWNDPERAQSLGKERAALEAVVDRIGDTPNLEEVFLDPPYVVVS